MQWVNNEGKQWSDSVWSEIEGDEKEIKKGKRMEKTKRWKKKRKKNVSGVLEQDEEGDAEDKRTQEE